MEKAVNDFIWAKSKSLTGIVDRPVKKKDKLAPKKVVESGVIGDDLSKQQVVAESEIKRRRYSAFMSDMVIFFISSEFKIIHFRF